MSPPLRSPTIRGRAVATIVWSRMVRKIPSIIAPRIRLRVRGVTEATPARSTAGDAGLGRAFIVGLRSLALGPSAPALVADVSAAAGFGRVPDIPDEVEEASRC